jgi:hypothetical protein
MPSIDTTQIQIQDNDGNAAPGSMQTTLYDTRDRMTRAAIRLGACWAAAGVTLFIPLAHFVLVPGFLLAGPIMAVSAYRTEQARELARGTCPVCKETVEIRLEAADNLPKWSYCPKCNAPLQLVAK